MSPYAMGKIPVILRGAHVLIVMMVLIFTEADGRSKLHSFEDSKLVPDVVNKAPADLAKVVYPGGVEVKEGNELTPTQVKDEPTVTWNANPDELYTLCMTDPDAPSREEPKFREWQHWLVGNIPGENIVCGETLSEYIGAAPPEGTGLHRYVFLVYQQPCELTFDEPRLTNTSGEKRPNFSINKFASKYKLGHPIAGNFFQAGYDDFVPVLQNQLE